jgi:hypothetical protein
VEVLRGLGMRILVDVVQRFGAAEDPHVEGHKLLELYQVRQQRLLFTSQPITYMLLSVISGSL